MRGCPSQGVFEGGCERADDEGGRGGGKESWFVVDDGVQLFGG